MRHVRLETFPAALTAALLSAVLSACAASGEDGLEDGLDCDRMETWSAPIEGYRINQRHLFCGESGRGGRAKGFHARPGGVWTSSYVRSEPGAGPNAAGVYTLRRIELELEGRGVTKSFSSMFPDHCSAEQVLASVAHARVHGARRCESPDWARCGPSGPETDSAAYCVGRDGRPFTVATADRGEGRINTGFPIFRADRTDR